MRSQASTQPQLLVTVSSVSGSLRNIWAVRKIRWTIDPRIFRTARNIHDLLIRPCRLMLVRRERRHRPAGGDAHGHARRSWAGQPAARARSRAQSRTQSRTQSRARSRTEPGHPNGHEAGPNPGTKRARNRTKSRARNGHEAGPNPGTKLERTRARRSGADDLAGAGVLAGLAVPAGYCGWGSDRRLLSCCMSTATLASALACSRRWRAQKSSSPELASSTRT